VDVSGCINRRLEWKPLEQTVGAGAVDGHDGVGESARPRLLARLRCKRQNTAFGGIDRMLDRNLYCGGWVTDELRVSMGTKHPLNATTSPKGLGSAASCSRVTCAIGREYLQDVMRN
jgi:hypothetical protein